MKKHVFFLLFAFLFSNFNFLKAQTGAVSEVEKLMSVGSRPAFRVDFQKADAARVLKLWKAFAKDQFDAKLKKIKKSEELIAYGVESSVINSEKFDLYSMVEITGKESSTLYVWFDLGSYFLNRRDNPDRAKNAADALERFADVVNRDVVTDELKMQEDNQKDLEKKLAKLQKAKEDLKKDIENYREKIKKAESDIVTNESDQVKAQSEIEKQKMTVEEVRRRLDGVGKGN